MSFLSATKICALCSRKKGRKKERLIVDALTALNSDPEAFTAHRGLKLNAELECISCDGKKPLMAILIDEELIAPMQRAEKRQKRKDEIERKERIRRQERREMHKRVAPSIIIEFDLAAAKIRAREGR